MGNLNDQNASKMNQNVVWFNNFREIDYPSIKLTKSIEEIEYSKVENVWIDNVIRIKNIRDIPYDYDGVMSVSCDFLNNFPRSQFEFLGNQKCMKVSDNCYKKISTRNFFTNGKELFSTALIRLKTPIRESP